MELSKLTALQLADKIKKHEISVLDGVKEVFSQIEEKDGQIHAYLDTYKKEAYARAKEVQKGIDEGIYTGPLAGVPIAVKDNICVQGKPTTCASKILEGFVPQYQAEVIDRLEKAGSDYHRKNKYGRVCHGKHHRNLCLRCHQKPVEHRACSRRFLRWLLRGCGSRGGLSGPWL